MEERDSREEIKANPFSFSNFSQSKRDIPFIEDNNLTTESVLIRHGSSRNKKEKILVILDDEKTEEEIKENPFSFKNFMPSQPSDTENNYESAKIDLDECDLPQVLDENLETNDSIKNIATNLERVDEFNKNEIIIRDNRIAYLESELVRIKAKEAEDTAALEKMVQQVEENLQVTTKRALIAEGQVTQLKQEVKSLQVQVKSLQKDVILAKVENSSQMNEEAQYLAEKLKNATEGAEVNLKSLLNAVSQLKEYSNLIANLGNVNEVK